MVTSKNGIALIKSFEGVRLQAYQCAAGVWTIGYGHTGGVKKGQTITLDEAEALLVNDLKRYEAKVNAYYDKYKWNQNEFDALVSFCYNIGNVSCIIGNGRTKYQIGQQMLLYVHAGGKKLAGLVRRRNAEYQLFMQSVPNPEVKQENKDYTYVVGKVYTTKVDGLIVRKAPSASAAKVGYTGLTASAKKHDRDKNGSLDKGTKVTCKAVEVDTSGNTWVRIPSGWVAAIYKREVFVG